EMAVSNIIFNAGQVCTLASRTIIPASKENEFIEAVKEVIPNFTVGTPDNEKSALGPLISKKQFDRVQGYIQTGMDEGATLAVGGPDETERDEQRQEMRQ